MSGFSHPGWPNVLDNGIWTERAERLRDILDFAPSRSWASLVELQLLAYLVWHHTLVLQDYESGEEFRQLAGAKPKCDSKAIITVNKDGFCSECARFEKSFGRIFTDIHVRFDFVDEQV